MFNPKWTNEEVAGLLPEFLDIYDPRGAVEQIDGNYAHGGGWRDFEGFVLVQRGGAYALAYPGDPAMREMSRTYLPQVGEGPAAGQRGMETVVLFEVSWVAVVQQDGAFRVARCG